MDLTGRWRAHPADEDLRREFNDLDYRDDAWELVTVPGHWRSVPAFADINGPMLYRHAFEAEPPCDDHRTWLWLDGIFSQGDVWLDGSYLGDTDGYFFPHAFEITAQADARREHVIGIEVGCPAVEEADANATLTGGFQAGDHLPARWNPGGIWRPVRLVDTGPVTIRHSRLLCREATEERATLALRLVLDTVEARPASVHTQVAGVDDELELSLAAGENRVEWTVAVPRPDRWWPHSLGPQLLHDVNVEVRLETGELSDWRRWRTGFRNVDLRNWICRVNGERLFLKGANLSPARADLGAADADELRAQLEVTRDAGLDFVRVHTHISRPELYRAADELGMLLWQDFPLHRRHARSIRGQATRQAREAVDLLGHHPSLYLWCGHDEPYTVVDDHRHTAIAPGVMPQQVPTWNRSILDRSVRRVFDKNDGTRPVIPHSGVLPHLPQLDGTDAHLWFGWYGGAADELAAFAATLPRHVRFVSAFGSQAVPDDADFCEPNRWPRLDWARLAEEHGLEVDVMSRVVPPESYVTFEDWTVATQEHQATIVKHAVETLRRLKYRPTGGFAVYRLSDVTPQIGFGLLDHRGKPKRAWYALLDACRPLVVVSDPLPATVAPGDELRLDVHVVSDERVDRRAAVITATLHGPLGERRWRWQGDIAADACVRVGSVDWIVPSTPGPVTLDLELTVDDVHITNQYRGRIAAG